MDKKYIFKIEGDITFTIEFQKGNFHHLFGLHKLRDQQVLVIKKPDNDATAIYEKILNQIEHYHQIYIPAFDSIFL